ncbi:hypothetical protein BJ991_002141 [Microbacterium immunditiarum]|uniref:Uncharacterized protein n=1 Tax=Microbacterium immunditiarum TaxID=337480 RepID=A0A7Y9GP57_9MICO|nr:hypothetical protein [Microbacterium immunditiarum]
MMHMIAAGIAPATYTPFGGVAPVTGSFGAALCAAG